MQSSRKSLRRLREKMLPRASVAQAAKQSIEELNNLRAELKIGRDAREKLEATLNAEIEAVKNFEWGLMAKKMSAPLIQQNKELRELRLEDWTRNSPVLSVGLQSILPQVPDPFVKFGTVRSWSVFSCDPLCMKIQSYVAYCSFLAPVLSTWSILHYVSSCQQSESVFVPVFIGHAFVQTLAFHYLLDPCGVVR